MRCAALFAAVGVCQAFVPSVSPIGASRAVCTAPSTAHASAPGVSMSAGQGSKRSVRPGSVSKVIRNIVMGNKKSSGNGLNNGNNGNKTPPPGGPLSASGAAGNDGRKNGGGLWGAYNANLDKHPIITKAITSMLGFALGDFLAQKFIDKRDELDLDRLARMASFGLLIHGPTGHYFYGFLDNKIPGTAALTVATKVFIDQVIWNPIFGTLFFGYMGAAEGLGGDAIKERIQNNLWASVKGSWTVWPVAHAINFRFIPTSQRLLYINSIQIGYNMFLSVLAKRANSDINTDVGSKVHAKASRAKSNIKHAANKAGNKISGRENEGVRGQGGAKSKIVKDSLLNRNKSMRD